MPAVKVANFFGGIDIKKNRDELKKTPPQVVVGTPGRIKQVRTAVLGPGGNIHDNYIRDKSLDLTTLSAVGPFN